MLMSFVIMDVRIENTLSHKQNFIMNLRVKPRIVIKYCIYHGLMPGVIPTVSVN